jgi:hypothetical protein
MTHARKSKSRASLTGARVVPTRGRAPRVHIRRGAQLNRTTFAPRRQLRTVQVLVIIGQSTIVCHALPSRGAVLILGTLALT